MPYKNKEDKTEAVRRHRAKKEVERKIMGEVMKHQKKYRPVSNRSWL